MSIESKLISWDQLEAWAQRQRAEGRTLVATNGCFDILHRGHVNYLQAASRFGDLLLVGVNSDQSVRELKGLHRPVNTETDRAFVLAALESVGAVCIFPERTALQFLRIARPQVYVKGGDYTIDTINQEERRLIEGQGGRVEVVAGVPGKSTTALLEKISRL